MDYRPDPMAVVLATVGIVLALIGVAVSLIR